MRPAAREGAELQDSAGRPLPSLSDITLLIQHASEKWGKPMRRRVAKVPDTHPLVESLRHVRHLRYATDSKPLAVIYATAAHDLKHTISIENHRLRCEEALNAKRSMPVNRRNLSWKKKLRRADGTTTEK